MLICERLYIVPIEEKYDFRFIRFGFNYDGY